MVSKCYKEYTDIKLRQKLDELAEEHSLWNMSGVY